VPRDFSLHCAEKFCIFSGAVVKKLATAIGAIALIGTPAFAADMAVKAPPPPPEPVYSWTGWYVGGNGGASFGNVKTDFHVAPTTFSTTGLGGSFTFTTPAFAGSNTEYPDGFMGGGQIGYNWQYSPLIVLGLEADIQGALEKDHNTLTSNFTTVALACIGISCGTESVNGSRAFDYQTKIDWFGTVRGRIGYVWGNGNVMSYLTGGLAYGRISIDGTATPFITSGGPLSGAQAFSHSSVNAGWVVGYGTEGKLLIPGWTYKIEGLYMDLGHLDAAAPGAFLSVTAHGITDTATAGPVTTHSHFTDGILRAGLNYQFH
jgi:outer membrane immunogenic protein